MLQKNIVKKYLRTHLDPAKTDERYKRYRAIFHNPEKIRHIRDSKEEQYQEGFLRDLFCAILGYTINPEPHYNLITEKKNDSDSRKADGAIILEDKVVAVIELKGCDTTDLSKVENQAFGYKAHNPGAHLVIISNFEKLRLYIEDASDFLEFNLFTMNREDFGLLYLCLSLENVAAQTALKLKRESLSAEISITDKLYADYSTFKRALFDDICTNNAPTQRAGTLDKLVLFKKTQKLLDRILFILFAEDRGILPENSILTIIAQWQKLKELDAYQPLYSRFLNYFNRINTGYKSEANPGYEIFAYNGGLFKPDEILDTIRVSDDVLYIHTKRLSEYDFESEVSVDILGHIFEHSLAEIEEIQEEIRSEEAGNRVSKRKKDGVFYTPAYITRYIVENTIGRLCDAKKAELGIHDGAFAQKRRNKSQRAELDEKLKAYRQWLLSLKICDPACGSGAFLNAALQFLKTEHALIDELKAKLYGDTLVFQEVENAILEHNLYGVDINEESVEIAKLSLWLHTAQRGRKLSTLSNNIKCGNSLIDDPEVAGEKAFCWEQEFPEVFGGNGFDVVIGNPPYVTRGMLENIKKYINSNYETAEYQLDLYICFMEKAVKLLSESGTIGFIVPNSWLKNMMMSKCRHFLLEKFNMTDIVRTSNVFKDASVDTIVYVGDNRRENQTKTINVLDFYNERARFNHLCSKERFINNNNFIFDIEVNEEMSVIIDKVNSDSVKIKDLFDVCRGINPYDKYRGQSEEIIRTKAYHATYKKDDTFVPLLQGRHIGRYFYEWDKQTYISYGDWLAAPREQKYFEGARIIFREILGKTLVSTILSEEIKIDRSLYIALPLNNDMNIYYVGGILNSILMSKYFRYTNNEFDDLFPKMRVAEFRELPIKRADADTQNCIAELVKRMLSLNADLQKSVQRFLKRVQDNLHPAKVSGALENFYAMEFADFVKELSKQKARLSLKQQDEWEDYFAEYKSACQGLTAEIAATDHQINQLVYQLYGLTEEEIAVVEGS